MFASRTPMQPCRICLGALVGAAVLGLGAPLLRCRTAADRPGEGRLQVAAEALASGSRGSSWDGSTPAARDLAERFGRRLQQRKASAFGGQDAGFAHQALRVRADLGPDGACFLVNVIDDVAEPTRAVVLDLAWRTAREVVGEHQGPEARLGVGLRSERGWLAIASGRGADAAPPLASPGELATFFVPVASTAAAATPGE